MIPQTTATLDEPITKLLPIPDTLYDDLTDELDELISNPSRYHFDSSQWLRWFLHYCEQSEVYGTHVLKVMRRYIQSHTIHIFKSLEYRCGEERVTIDEHSLKESCLHVQYYSTASAMKCVTECSKGERVFGKTRVTVMVGDCLDAALMLEQDTESEKPQSISSLVEKLRLENEQLKHGKKIIQQQSLPKRKVAVLNMASSRRPGGGYMEGCGSQEENLFRRTSLAFSLADIEEWDGERSWYYPIDKTGGVYVPNVSVIRGSELAGYPFLKRVHNLDVICVSAFRTPKLDHTGKKLHSSVVEDVRKKIRLMFAMALQHQVTCLVLSAWGCGAYRNPPEHIAQLMKSVLNEYDGMFEQVVFAIYNDQNARTEGGNVLPFEKEFGMKAVPTEEVK